MGIYNNLRNNLANALLGQQASNSAIASTLTNDTLANYQDYLRQNGFDESIVNGVAQGLNSGNKDIADWINQYNAGAGRSTPINIPKTDEEIGLARQGLFNTPQLTGSAQMSPRVGGLLPDLFHGYQENYSNSFNPSNWGNNTLADGRNKGLVYRTGELLGSLGRVVDSPLGRGLIAAGLNRALGYDNSLQEGLTAFVGRQNAQSADALYRNSLAQQGIDLSNVRGNVSKDMYNNVAKATTSAQRAQNQLTIASLKDNTSRARMIGVWVKNGIITPQEGSALASAYGITDADFQASNDTRKTDSQIALNEAKIDNINNPKPKVSKVIHESRGAGSTPKSASGKPIGVQSNNTGKVKMRYNGAIYNVDANRVQEYIKAGGEVVK